MHLLDEMNREPVKTARLAEGRHAHPTAGVIDRQSVKPTESGRFRGHHAGKKDQGPQAPHWYRYDRIARRARGP